MKPIATADELDQLIGQPLDRVRKKVRRELSAFDRQWLAASPFCVISTADAQGRVDASPKGDPAGFIEVLDDNTIAIPERPGNKLAFGFRNILENPNVGILSVVPGRTDTHCGKAFLRSGLWDPGSWNPEALPSIAVLSKTYVQPDTPLEELESYYGPSYTERMYRE